jgi:hypothetical protein
MQKELLTDRDDLFVIRNFCSGEDCDALIARTEEFGYGDAPIMTPAGPVVNKGMRNNERVMFDDVRLADELWIRLGPLVPERMHG